MFIDPDPTVHPTWVKFCSSLLKAAANVGHIVSLNLITKLYGGEPPVS